MPAGQVATPGYGHKCGNSIPKSSHPYPSVYIRQEKAKPALPEHTADSHRPKGAHTHLNTITDFYGADARTSTSYGRIINERHTCTLKHVSHPNLPFGGVGETGIGTYHGRCSFETFSHRKGIYTNCLPWDLPVLFPPYTDSRLNLLKKVLG